MELFINFEAPRKWRLQFFLFGKITHVPAQHLKMNEDLQRWYQND